MSISYLDYLTLPNPTTDSSRSKDGSNHKTSGSYGPDEVKPWTDLTLENFGVNYKDVLLRPIATPQVRSADNIDPELCEIWEETSVVSLAEHWNERIVQHAIEGTRKPLHAKLPDGPFDDGKIYFTKNKGRGNLQDGDGNVSRPDWCLYQKTASTEADEHCANLLPGDAKPAKKWKADWINSVNPHKKRKADLVLAQITKYMCLAETRYGFVLSEDELVAMRMSRFERDVEALEQLAQEDTAAARQMLDSTFDLENDPDGAFADTERRVGTLLEFCSIPWTVSGPDNLTINLALWWLSVLAVQRPPIKDAGDYASMGAMSPTSNTSPGDLGLQKKDHQDHQEHQEHHRSAEESTTKRQSKASRSMLRPSVQTRSSKARQTRGTIDGKRPPSAEITRPGQSFTSDTSSRASKRRRRVAASFQELRSDTEQESSQGTDNYKHSFDTR